MKRSLHVSLILSACLYCTDCTTEQSHSRDGSMLDGRLWSWYSSDPESQLQDVWTKEEGILVCSGTPLGYLYSKADFDDFVLTLEWRWPADKEPGKGGVLVRMTGEHTIWPKSLEAQLNAGDAGDFWGLNGYELVGPPDRTRSIDHDTFGKLTNIKKTRAVEKPPGQWNTYKIIADGDTVTLIINGTEVNRATGCAPRSGKVCLTSEGSEIHFRKVRVMPLAGR
jgi:hypothetical protein